MSSNSPPPLQSQFKPRVSSFNETPRDRATGHDDHQPLDPQGLGTNANPCFQRSHFHSQNCSPHDPHRSLTLLPLNDLHALPRPPRRACLSRRLTRRWLRKHHRILNPLRPSGRNGTHLRTGLRCQKVHPPRSLPSKNHSPPPLHFSSYLSSLALHEAYPSLVRPGRGHSHTSTILSSLLHPRPHNTIISSPFTNLPSNPIHYSASHPLRHSLNSPPRPHQLPPRFPPQSGNQRRGSQRGVDQPQPSCFLDSLRSLLRHA